MNDDNQEPLETGANILEGEETVTNTNNVSPADGQTPPIPQETNTPTTETNQPVEATPQLPSKPKLSFVQKIEHYIKKINVYILLFIFILILAGIATFASYRSSKNTGQNDIDGQTLSVEDLQNLKNNNATVGDAKDTLTIASNAIFNGRVLARNDLDVAGTLRVGENISLTGMTASGTSTLEDLQVGNNLSVAGNAAVQGTMSIQSNLTVSGGASFAGPIYAPSINVDQFTINQNLVVNRHIDAGGSTPSVSPGPGMQGGGTVSIGGNDTAGTVNLNFGASPIAGILAYITFVNAFSDTPHVVITPVGSSCSGLNFYVNRSSTGFSIASTNAGSAGANCAFDYIIIN